MLRIDRMRMQLPAGFEHRASSIARKVGESLLGIQSHESRIIDRLSISPVKISINATDQEIAQSVTQQIALTLGRQT